MVFYFVRHYAVNVLVLVAGIVVIPLFWGVPLSTALPRAVFWGGLAAGGYIYRRFRIIGLWPLYDNIRIPRIALIVAAFVVLQGLNIAVMLLR